MATFQLLRTLLHLWRERKRDAAAREAGRKLLAAGDQKPGTLCFLLYALFALVTHGSIPHAAVEHVNVLIIGAGLSGVGAAVHLLRNCPEKRFAILESRSAIGGTWDLFRYPGVRSDSDMFTLGKLLLSAALTNLQLYSGYAFKPWVSEQSVADGPKILAYVRETAREFGVDKAIRFRHRVQRIEWSTADARWTVFATRTSGGDENNGALPGGEQAEPVQLTCDFVYGCVGYYRYDQGFNPRFEGQENFKAREACPCA